MIGFKVTSTNGLVQLLHLALPPLLHHPAVHAQTGLAGRTVMEMAVSGMRLMIRLDVPTGLGVAMPVTVLLIKHVAIAVEEIRHRRPPHQILRLLLPLLLERVKIRKGGLMSSVMLVIGTIRINLAFAALLETHLEAMA
jgi:hypothetical protein